MDHYRIKRVPLVLPIDDVLCQVQLPLVSKLGEYLVEGSTVILISLEVDKQHRR